MPEIGEYVVGAYLKQIYSCDVVDYNVRPPSPGLEGLAEFDVIGLKFADRLVYLCEVTTHLDGVKYGGNKKTFEVIRKKHDRQRWYARTYLKEFTDVRYMFWSPVVRRGYLTDKLVQLEELELIINDKYKACVTQLREAARKTTKNTGNPFFRTLQLLAHLRD